MTRTSLLGSFPTFKRGPNTGRLDRKATAKALGWSNAEIGKAYNNWIQIFRKQNSTLTFEEYCDKLKEAKIRPYDVGCVFGKYSLSRYTDDGPYTFESCRFILCKDNRIEQDLNGRNLGKFKKRV